MKHLMGVCSVVFALMAPLLAVAGPLTKLGVSGPAALCIGGALMTGAFLLLRRRT